MVNSTITFLHLGKLGSTSLHLDGVLNGKITNKKRKQYGARSRGNTCLLYRTVAGRQKVPLFDLSWDGAGQMTPLLYACPRVTMQVRDIDFGVTNTF